jgi:hypothetical protein
MAEYLTTGFRKNFSHFFLLTEFHTHECIKWDLVLHEIIVDVKYKDFLLSNDI